MNDDYGLRFVVMITIVIYNCDLCFGKLNSTGF